MAQVAEPTPALDPAMLAFIPPQGDWSESDYRWLSGRTNRLVELTEGMIEFVAPTPRFIRGYQAYSSDNFSPSCSVLEGMFPLPHFAYALVHADFVNRISSWSWISMIRVLAMDIGMVLILW